jgi:hypothetical protein
LLRGQKSKVPSYPKKYATYQTIKPVKNLVSGIRYIIEQYLGKKTELLSTAPCAKMKTNTLSQASP